MIAREGANRGFRNVGFGFTGPCSAVSAWNFLALHDLFVLDSKKFALP